MTEEDYDRGYSDGYDCGLSKDKDTSFLLLAHRIDELKSRISELEAVIDLIIAYDNTDDDGAIRAARAAYLGEKE
jgi:hypothetical protein